MTAHRPEPPLSADMVHNCGGRAVSGAINLQTANYAKVFVRRARQCGRQPEIAERFLQARLSCGIPRAESARASGHGLDASERRVIPDQLTPVATAERFVRIVPSDLHLGAIGQDIP